MTSSRGRGQGTGQGREWCAAEPCRQAETTQLLYTDAPQNLNRRLALGPQHYCRFADIVIGRPPPVPDRLLHKRSGDRVVTSWALPAPGSGSGVGRWAARVRENQEKKGTTKGAREQPSQSAGGQASGTTYPFLCGLRLSALRGARLREQPQRQRTRGARCQSLGRLYQRSRGQAFKLSGVQGSSCLYSCNGGNER